MTTRHTTEALARKAARRHARETVRVVKSPLLSGPGAHYHVETAEDITGTLSPETVLYHGPGYLCPKEDV